MAATSRKPAVKFILACQRVIKEENTGLISLISIFRALTAKSLPLSLGPIYVFASLADAQGDYEFRLEIVRVNDDKKVGEIKLPIVTIEDPAAHGEMTIEINRLTFHEAGTYDLRLWANEWFLANTDIAVTLVQSEQEGDHG